MKLKFLDHQDLKDLEAFLTRAKRLDEDGLVRLRAFSDVLAVYVAPIFSGSLLSDGPTIIGLRTIKLDGVHEVDAAFEISSILERLAAQSVVPELQLPPSPKRASWIGISPPRTGWEAGESIAQTEITAWAKAGIAEVATAIPDSIGSAIAGRVRLQIWGKSVGLSHNFPSGAAFALAGLGFMSPGESVQVYRTSGWVRLSTRHGHVLCKESFRIS